MAWLRAKNGCRKAPSENFGMVPTWKTKKGKILKFLDAGGSRNGGKANSLGIGRLGGVEKENKTLGTERCENAKNLYK